MKSPGDEKPGPVSLRRALSLPEVTLSGVGVILGAGIYALLGEGTTLAGGAVWLSFAMAAVIAVLSGAGYAELAAMYPRAGAEFEYVSRAGGVMAGIAVGWLVLISGIIAAATVALGFAGYAAALTGLPGTPLALALILLLTLLQMGGIRNTALLAIVFTLIEAGGLGILLVIGLPHLGQADLFAMPRGWTGVFQASVLLFFAYTGFEGIVKFAEETRDPARTIPRALFLSLGITIVLYVAVAVAAVSVVGWQALAESRAPFALVAGEVLGNGAFLVMAGIALCATANTALLFLLAASRIMYGMAGAGVLPRIFAKVDTRHAVPREAVACAGIIAAIFAAAGKITFTAGVTNFTLFLTFAAVNTAVILLRMTEPKTPRPFRVPGSIRGVPLLPAAGILVSVLMMTAVEPPAIAIGLILAAVAVVAAYIAAGKRKRV